MYCCSVAKSCLTLCDPVDYSILSSPVFHYLLEFARIHVHWVSDVIETPHLSTSFPASGSFLMSQLFPSGGQSIGVSSSASVLPMNIQGWFPLRLTGLISLQSKGLSRVFSNTTVQNTRHLFSIILGAILNSKITIKKHKNLKNVVPSSGSLRELLRNKKVEGPLFHPQLETWTLDDSSFCPLHVRAHRWP